VLELAVVSTAPSKKVLVVEDEADVVEMLVRAFKRTAGFNVITAEDGAIGLRRARQESPVLVILDLMLPGLNGFEVLRRYRGRGGPAAVLILSARDQEVDKVQGFRIGADDYVVKPVGVLELLARVAAAIRGERR